MLRPGPAAIQERPNFIPPDPERGSARPSPSAASAAIGTTWAVFPCWPRAPYRPHSGFPGAASNPLAAE